MENEKMSDEVKYPVLSKINMPEDVRISGVENPL